MDEALRAKPDGVGVDPSPYSKKQKVAITLSLGSAAHHKNLPEVFAARGILRRAVRYGQHLEFIEPVSGGVKIVRRLPAYYFGNRVIWAIWNRLPEFAQWPGAFIAWSGVVDTVVSRWIVPSDVFHGLAGSFLSSLHRARQLDALVVIDNSFLHPDAFRREVEEDCKPVGANPRIGGRFLPAMLVRRLLRQYEMCDRIIVYSSAAQRSFAPFSYASKTIVVRPGVNHELFVPAKAAKNSATFRVCYVGRIEAPKGLAHLIAAWKQLALPEAELLLVGNLLAEIEPLLRDCSSVGIRMAGILSREAVVAALQSSDLFVLPSMNEGMSLALLEAMSVGLPVIGCADTGAADCITPGENGFLVPGRNTEALADAIRRCYENRDALAQMGRASRERIEREFTLAHYQDRLVRLYESLTITR
jgi:glycosyltransferase involved in cell wall biosynthesis